MALRNILKEGDPILNKVSRNVTEVDDRVCALLDDMKETMYAADGVGLAAPQVGILKRVVVIDIGNGVLELINPEIVCSTGEQYEVEGCLSLPGISGITERPMNVQVRALDREGHEVMVTGTGLLARALCHEIDHLDGILFRQRVTEYCEG
ncbi:MAG: peptide deformylase [Ruminococcaceae bacterium]|nr:peptide deformylase [Oscillospiraceae bacterium]